MADPTPDAPEPDAPAPSSAEPTQTDDPAAMAEALKKANAEAKKYRLEAKAHADRLAQLEQQHMSDADKAIADARAEARAEALRETGSRLVVAEFRAAAAGRNLDVKTLLKGIDAAKFLDDDGEPDADAIQKWVDQIAPAGDARPRVPAGVRTTGSPKANPADDFATFLGDALRR